MQEKKYLVHSFRRIMMIGLFLLAISSAIIIILLEYFNYVTRLESLKSEHQNRIEVLLKKDVVQVTEMIRQRRATGATTLENQLKADVELARKLIVSYAQAHQLKRNGPSLKKHLVNILSQFSNANDPNDYFFAFTPKGQVYTWGRPVPLTDGQVLRYRNSAGIFIIKKIIESSMSGVLTINYLDIARADKPTVEEKKLIVSVYIPELDVVIGTGKFLSDHTAEVQRTILKELDRLQRIREGYIFIGAYNGESLLGPASGHNMWQVQDANGLYVVQSLIAKAKHGGGYLRYQMPRQVNLAQQEKLSYVEGIDDWQWYVGAGDYLEGIQELVAKGRKELVERSIRQIFLIAAFYLFVLFIFFTLSDEIAQTIRKQIEQFRRDFKGAEEGIGIISRETIEFAELDSIAESANRMIEVRQLIEVQSEEKSTELERLNSELKVKTKEAVRATEAKARFLANMSHEIRTPLNAIIGMSDVLYDSPLSSQQRDYLGILKRSGEHLLMLINDILDFSKIESGKISVENELVDLRNICEDSLGVVATRYTNTIFSFSYAEDLSAFVHSDPFRLRQILINLLSNAGKATPTGEVCISVSKNEQHLIIDIIDTGIGIDQAHLESIFELFSQINGSFNKKYEGTGLGLTISRSLAQLLGGEIKVKSKLGEGSTFSLLLPVGILATDQVQKKLPQLLDSKKIHVYSPFSMERKNLAQHFVKLGASVEVWEALTPDFFRHAHQLFICLGVDGLTAEEQQLVLSSPLPVVWSAFGKQNIYDISYLPLFNMLPRPVHLSQLYNFFLRFEGNFNELRYNPIDVFIIDATEAYGRILEQQVLAPFIRSASYANSREQALAHMVDHDYGLILIGDSVCRNEDDYFSFIKELQEFKGKQALCLMLERDLATRIPPALSRIHHFNKLSSRDYIFQLIYGILGAHHRHQQDEVAISTSVVRRILVVDDGPSNLLLVQVMLKDLPIEVTLANSGKQAIEINDTQGPFDLILMDIQMPDMDGMATTEIIRRKEKELGRWPVSIFALTAYALKEEHEKIMASGCNGILTKPIQKHTLCDFLREFYHLPNKP